MSKCFILLLVFGSTQIFAQNTVLNWKLPVVPLYISVDDTGDVEFGSSTGITIPLLGTFSLENKFYSEEDKYQVIYRNISSGPTNRPIEITDYLVFITVGDMVNYYKLDNSSNLKLIVNGKIEAVFNNNVAKIDVHKNSTVNLTFENTEFIKNGEVFEYPRKYIFDEGKDIFEIAYSNWSKSGSNVSMVPIAWDVNQERVTNYRYICGDFVIQQQGSEVIFNWFDDYDKYIRDKFSKNNGLFNYFGNSIEAIFREYILEGKAGLWPRSFINVTKDSVIVNGAIVSRSVRVSSKLFRNEIEFRNVWNAESGLCDQIAVTGGYGIGRTQFDKQFVFNENAWEKQSKLIGSNKLRFKRTPTSATGFSRHKPRSIHELLKFIDFELILLEYNLVTGKDDYMSAINRNYLRDDFFELVELLKKNLQLFGLADEFTLNERVIEYVKYGY